MFIFLGGWGGVTVTTAVEVFLYFIFLLLIFYFNCPHVLQINKHIIIVVFLADKMTNSIKKLSYLLIKHHCKLLMGDAGFR